MSEIIEDQRQLPGKSWKGKRFRTLHISEPLITRLWGEVEWIANDSKWFLDERMSLMLCFYLTLSIISAPETSFSKGASNLGSLQLIETESKDL